MLYSRLNLDVIFNNFVTFWTNQRPFLDQPETLYWTNRRPFIGPTGNPYLDQPETLYWTNRKPFLDQPETLFWTNRRPFFGPTGNPFWTNRRPFLLDIPVTIISWPLPSHLRSQFFRKSPTIFPLT